MPREGQYADDSLSFRITTWLREHPGAHRPRDIAAGLGVPGHRTRSQWTMDIGRECSRMYLRGQLLRGAGTVITAGGVRGSAYLVSQDG